jgi:hypothetical protein
MYVGNKNQFFILNLKTWYRYITRNVSSVVCCICTEFRYRLQILLAGVVHHKIFSAFVKFL